MRLLTVLAALTLVAPLVAESLPIDALPQTFIRGERPAAWPQDEIVVVECWARWCGPCVRAMPHMEALHQELKDEGVSIIGLNVWEKASDQQLLDFLAKQPTPPTYDIAADRAGALPKRLGVKGIPHAIVVREGEILWQGHPANLTAEKLRAWRDERKPLPSKKIDPRTKPAELEGLADRAAATGDWDAAIKLQHQAFRLHPLAAKAKSLPEPPEGPALDKVLSPAIGVVTSEGDAAPYAALLGQPIPADDVPTLIAYWPNPFWVAKLTWATLASLPDRRIAKALPYPHRTITVTPLQSKNHLQNLLRPLDWRGTDIRCVADIPTERFGHNDRYNPPFVAYFRNGKLLWTGALEVMPAALRTATPPATPEAVQAAIAEEDNRQQELGAAFKALHTATPEEREAILKTILDRPLPKGWGSILLPQILATPYQAKDLAAGKARLEECMTRFNDDAGALEMLLKVIDAWPELSLEAGKQRCRIAERLGELNDRNEPGYAQAWFAVAAEEAERIRDTDAAQRLYRRALEVSPSACRLRQFRAHLPALPTR